MGTPYIDRRGTRLEFDRGAMVVREPDATPRSVPLSLVERLVVVGDVQLSARLLTRLAENGSGVTILPGRGGRRGTFLNAHGHGDVDRRIGQYRLVTNVALKTEWARRLVWLRLAGQRRLLNAAMRTRPDLRHPLGGALSDLHMAMAGIRSQGVAASGLRGREGAATATFFRGYRTLFPASLCFEQRNRRPPRDPVNAALSLAYTLVHGDALKAVSANGLEPTLGVLHEPFYGRDSLACDLAEVARTRAERLVWRLFAERELSEHNFASSQSGVLLAKSGREAFFRAYEGGARLHRRWLFRIARHFARACQDLSDIPGAAAGGNDAPR
ncbi:CRISPR-associated exonuclease Cas4/endonuclease Cas1 fusion [wastewater metagenome]|uniref:CRISPR-associated exonuclease Cas4/endonuclease Cas1 fusion n=2 Tax=unclassified sequences TaxID=12908 RepID=A0A5B8RJM2_9ZZZZ|nr:CRISPR-associated exonuclease Cas4/endonuclease Cas1 fusion [uncultured organism]